MYTTSQISELDTANIHVLRVITATSMPIEDSTCYFLEIIKGFRLLGAFGLLSGVVKQLNEMSILF